MYEVKVCRICLCYGVKMYGFDTFELQYYYEQTMACKVYKDGLPQFACYECASLLHKFHKFKEKSRIGQKTLKEILARKGSITYNSIDEINRQSKNLHSSLDIINNSNNKNVRTSILKKRSANKLRRKDLIENILLPVDDSFKEEVPIENITLIADVEEPHIINVEYDEYKVDPSLPENEKHIAAFKLPETNKVEVISEEPTLLDSEIPVEIEPKVDIDDTDKDYEYFNQYNDDDGFSSDDNKVLIDIHKKTDDLLVIHQHDNVSVLQKKILAKKRRKENEAFKSNRKKKRFEGELRGKEKELLSSANWQKYNLNEDDAEKEFKARAASEKFKHANFKCLDCLKGFSKEDMLIRHKKLRHHESLGPFECRFCRMRFKWKCFLSRHMREHYVRYQCLRCELRCSLENSAVFHEEYHNGVIRKCKHCGEEFRHSSTYYTHLRTHRSTYVCTLCGASFVSRAGLSMHTKMKHVDQPAELAPQKPAEGEATKTKPTYCEKCDIHFMTKEAYDQHLFQSALHDETEEGTFEAMALKRRKGNKRTSRTKPTSCVQCGKHFTTQSACMKHHLSEHPRTSFYSEKDRHICEICGISLAAVSVQSHLNTHTREKMFTCTTCGVQFNTKTSLSRHQLTHTGEKPFPCLMCDKRFTQRGSMMLHYRTFHLKQPYPKRNRRKKTEEVPLGEAYRTDGSEENLSMDRWR